MPLKQNGYGQHDAHVHQEPFGSKIDLEIKTQGALLTETETNENVKQGNVSYRPHASKHTNTYTVERTYRGTEGQASR